jgi:hypothetical protein
MIKLAPDYCIDTSALIDFNRTYPKEIFPTLWEKMELMIKNGNLVAPKEVFKEILKWDDSLTTWAKRHQSMFKDLTDEQIGKVKKILTDFPRLVDPDKETPDADPFIVALAMTGGDIVVTSEKMSNPGGRPKIQDVCEKKGIRCITLLDFFKEMGWKF